MNVRMEHTTAISKHYVKTLKKALLAPIYPFFMVLFFIIDLFTHISVGNRNCKLSCEANLPLGFIPDGFECHDTKFGIVVTKFLYRRYSPSHAKSNCASFGDHLHLPIPANSVQNKWYRKYMVSRGHDSMWLGISDVESHRIWKSDRGLIQTYTNWYRGGPTDFEFGHFVEMFSNGKWINEADFTRPTLCTDILPHSDGC